MRPKLKPFHPVCRISPETLRVGTEASTLSEIDDVTGQAEAFLRLLDGTLTKDELAERTGLSLDEVEEAITELDTAGFIEDASTQPNNLSETEVDRYGANIAFFSHFCSLGDNKWVYQERLKAANVCIIGIGGGGTHVLSHLVAAGVGRITIVDYDQVELTNLNRQLLYTASDIGRPKVEAAAEHCNRINPHVQVAPTVQRVSSKLDVARVIQDADLIVLTADEPNLGIFRWVNSVVVRKGIPVVLAFSQIVRGCCTVLHSGQGTGCMDCLVLAMMDKDPTWAPFQRTLAELNWHPPTATLVPHVALLASMVSIEALKILAGYAPPSLYNRMIEFNFLTLESGSVAEWERHENCPTCGQGKLEDHPFLQEIERRWG